MDIAYKENVMVNQLWLNRISNFIKVDALKNKYSYKPTKMINPIIGEFDDPINQQQHLLTLPISEQGNTLIYGIPGSGKELVLTTTVYSSVTTYTPNEINFYILDFGSETMLNLRNLPHVGDVILQHDKDKLENLFKLLNTHLEERKNLFLNYSGSINEYKKATNQDIPSIIVMINGFDSFNEIYPDYSELLTKYTRECPRFGIYFMLTATGSNSIRYKLSQNFKLILTLELNDRGDYYSIIGKTNLTPTFSVGRGLVKILDDIYEFQTAFPSREEESSDFFKNLANTLNEKYSTKALKIPVLPELVNMSLFDDISDLNHIPIGIFKDNLSNCYYDFKKNFFNKIVANELENTLSFNKELISIFNKIRKFKTYLFDPNSQIKETYNNVLKYTANFDEVLTSMNESITKIYQECEANNFDPNLASKYQPILVVIHDFNAFKQKTTGDFNTIITNLYNINLKLPIINFVITSSINELKNYEFESWFKQISDQENAIWIGEGIANQFMIKLTKSSDRALQMPIKNDFGYIVVNGKHALIKVLTFNPKDLEKINNEVEEL